MNKFLLSRADHGNPVAAVVTLALVLGLCGRADSSTLIQITPDNPVTTDPGFVVLSSGWNVLNPLRSAAPVGLAGYDVANLVDSFNNPTGISLTANTTNRFNDYNTNGSTASSLDFPADVRRESFYGNSVISAGLIQPTATWTFGGFDPDDDLIFTFFASRIDLVNPMDNREGKYEVLGATTESDTLDARNNNSNTASVTVKADALGNVVLNMTKGPNNNNASGFFYLNAMSIEVIPEPSSTLMVLVAGLGLCMVRRRG